MSDDPVRLLTRLNPEPLGHAPAFEVVWPRVSAGDALSATDAAARAARPSGRRRVRVSGSGILLACLVGLAVAIGLGAVLVLHHEGRSAPPVAPAQSIPPASRGLVGILGVLRRPQTAADRAALRSLGVLFRHFRAGVAVPSRVRASGGRQAIVLIPMRPRNKRWAPGATNALFADRTGLRLAVIAAGGGAGCCVTAAGIEAGQGWSTFGGERGSTSIFVVPDGVARLTLHLPRPVTARVRDNVAVVVTATMIENPTVDGMTWYDSAGRVVRSFPSTLRGSRRGARHTPAHAAAG